MHTFAAAKLSSQHCLQAVQTVLSEKEGSSRYERGYCIVRPPGHHADYDSVSGFCFFNNAAIAAQYAVNQGKKVLIFDWDIHAGDGT
jgi:histone deacetylase 6